MNSPTTPCAMTTHQAMMKCPWQWRPPFLDEKLESRKRKVGDGFFYDPVDPNFVDHLLPGHAKKFCPDADLESDEKEKIQREIARLTTKKAQLQTATMLYDALLLGEELAVKRPAQTPDALVDSILQLSSDPSALLASPKSVASSEEEDEASDSSSGEDEPAELSLSLSRFADRGHEDASGPLELVSDNLQDEFFTAEDSVLLDFQSAAGAHD